MGDKLSKILKERYMRLLEGVASMESIRKAEPEWQKICDSFGIWRSPPGMWVSPLPKKLSDETILVKDPEPFAAVNHGMLVVPQNIAEKILVLGSLPC